MRWKAESLRIFGVAVVLLTLCGACLAQASRVANLGGNQRVALVIGNEKYANKPLPNATGDARAVAQRLRELGFSVREHHNLGKARMEEEYRSYTLALQDGGGLGVLYYSGHGAQFGGQTYLVPIDAEMTDPRAAAFWAVALEPMVAVFERLANRGNIVILDACRTNEFGREASRSRGLAAVSLAGVRNTLIEYATSPGQVAADGPPGTHSPYTEALLQHMSAPNVEVGDMFRRVRQSVEAATRNNQSPWSAGGLRTRVVLADQARSISTAAPPGTGSVAAVPGTETGAGILKYLGTDRGIARFAKIRDVMATDFGRQPISGDQFAAVMNGLSGQQVVEAAFMLSQNVEQFSANNVRTVALLAAGEHRMSVLTVLLHRFEGALTMADALAILGSLDGRWRQGVLMMIQQKLPARMSADELLRLLGDAPHNEGGFIDVLETRVDKLTFTETSRLVTPVKSDWERVDLLKRLLPKTSGSATVEQVKALVGEGNSAGHGEILQLLAPRLPTGLTSEQADTLVAGISNVYRRDAMGVLAPKLAPAALAPQAAPASPEPPPETRKKASKQERNEARVAAARAVPSAAPQQPVERVPARADTPPIAMPPIGDNLILTEPQMRYCQYEQARLLALKALLTPQTRAAHAQFSERAADFNARCRRYRYPTAIRGKIDAEVAERQAQFAREAHATINSKR